MFRTILVYVDTTPESEARAKVAADIARQFDAKLIGFTAGEPHLPIEVYAAGLGVTTVGSQVDTFDEEHVEAEFGKAGDLFRRVTAASGVRTEWQTALAAPAIALAKAAAAADLLILGPERQGLLDTNAGPVAGEVVLRVGRPVLVIPPGASEAKAENVLVAWKDSPEAQRALADAVPFLKRAAKVTLVQVHEGEDKPAELDAAKAYLSAHGITAKAETIPSAATVVDAILAFATREKADLIVAGAYGHGRFAEWVLGGVTRGLLTRAPVPCLLSH